jgi:hypothetical protein
MAEVQEEMIEYSVVRLDGEVSVPPAVDQVVGLVRKVKRIPEVGSRYNDYRQVLP